MKILLPSKLKKAIEDQFPSAAAAIEANCLPSIRLTLQHANDESIPVGKTKVGGLPDLPNGHPWPTLEVRIPPQSAGSQERYSPLPGDTPIPYMFKAQIDLSEAARFDDDGLLPKKGLLSFFFCPEVFESDGQSREGDWKPLTTSADGTNTYLAGAKNACVLYFEDASRLERATEPEASPAQNCKIVTFASKVTLSSEVTLPQVQSPYVGNGEDLFNPPDHRPVMLGADDYEAYETFTREMEGRHKVCQMLGHADQVQGYVLENEFRDVQRELFPEIKGEIEYGNPFHRGSRLLLQLSSAFDNPYYFFAREDDLRRGDFSRVWGIQVRG